MICEALRVGDRSLTKKDAVKEKLVMRARMTQIQENILKRSFRVGEV